jgi:hypothetical protein
VCRNRRNNMKRLDNGNFEISKGIPIPLLYTFTCESEFELPFHDTNKQSLAINVHTISIALVEKR